MKGDWHGDCEVILSLPAEEDVSYLRKYLPEHGEGMDHALYVLFRMFCGGELHIVADHLTAEVRTDAVDGKNVEPVGI